MTRRPSPWKNRARPMRSPPRRVRLKHDAFNLRHPVKAECFDWTEAIRDAVLFVRTVLALFSGCPSPLYESWPDAADEIGYCQQYGNCDDSAKIDARDRENKDAEKTQKCGHCHDRRDQFSHFAVLSLSRQ